MNKNKHEFVKCNCGCSMLVVEKLKDCEYMISTQDSRLINNYALSNRLKNAVKVLFGSPLYWTDILLSKSELSDFITRVSAMEDNK